MSFRKLAAVSTALPLLAAGADPMPYGDVDFSTSCSDAVQADFNTAMSTLYSFWYSQSLVTFEDIIAREPACCMAYYGAAMTYNRPIWDFITDDRLAAAEEYSIKASDCASGGGATDREQAYIGALSVYMNTTNPEVADPATRLQTYADAFNEKVYLPYGPTDENAAVLYGLAVLGVGYYSDTEPSEGYPNLKLAGLTEELVVLRNENSPGGLHYVIHSYDQPPIASRALDAAYQYLATSVAVPHAVHMPSHIFGDLGLWADMIKSNQQCLNLAWSAGDKPTGDWYHGSYFMQFGMLQMAMDCDAKAFVEAYVDMSEKYTEDFLSEGSVRVPAMYLIETRSWEQGATFDLEKMYPAVSPAVWTEHAWTLVTSNFVATVSRAVLDYSAAEIAAAREAMDAAHEVLLASTHWTVHQLPYWRQSIEVMVNSAHAWESFRTVSFEAGIAAMQAVVDYAESGWAPEVSQTWDTHEQLAEMLLIRGAKGDVARALKLYETEIAMYPNRYRPLAGAAKCADTLNNDIKASKYYGELITLTSPPYPDISMDGISWEECPRYTPDRRPEIVEAMEYFALIDQGNN